MVTSPIEGSAICSKPGDFSPAIRPHFHDHRLMDFPDIKKREGKADQIVEIPLVLQNPLFQPDDAGRHFLGLVFPELPVTAKSGIEKCLLQKRAMSPSAFNGS